MTDHWQYRSARSAARRYVELESQLQGSSQAINPEWILTKGSVRRRPSSSSDDAVSERHSLGQVFVEAERRRALVHGNAIAARDRVIWEANRMHDITFRVLAEEPALGISKSRAAEVATEFGHVVLGVLEDRGLRYLGVSPDEDRRLNSLAPMRVPQEPWGDDG